MRRVRGQVTIFIIIAIFIVGAVLMFLLLRGDQAPRTSGGQEIEKLSFLESCMEEKMEDSLSLISIQGGNIEPKLYQEFQFNNEELTKISFLCYQRNFYLPCVNQEPILLNHIKKEIYDSIEDKVRDCFTELELSLDGQGFTVDSTYRDFEVIFSSRSVNVDIDAQMILTKSGETTRQDDFEIIFSSKFYDIIRVVQEIVNQESRFCHFNKLGYMLTYPEWQIERFITGESIKLYTVTHVSTKEKFRFAIRSCVIPPGI